MVLVVLWGMRGLMGGCVLCLLTLFFFLDFKVVDNYHHYMKTFKKEIDTGRLLEEAYRQKMAEAINPTAADLLLGDVDTGAGYGAGRNLLNKPMYESLESIPLNIQIEQIIKNIQDVKKNPNQQYIISDPNNKERVS